MEVPYHDEEFRKACRLKLNKPDLPNTEFDRFMFEAEARGLNPLLGHLWIQKRRDQKRQVDIFSFETTIDGLRFIAERSGEYCGQDEPKIVRDEAGAIISATVTVYRYFEKLNEPRPYTSTAHFNEYVQKDRSGHVVSMWKSMPANQISKCAESGAFRKAFPETMGQLYTTEEMTQADNPDAAETPPVGTSNGQNDKPNPVSEAQPGAFSDEHDEQHQREVLKTDFSALAHEKLAISNETLGKAIAKMCGLASLKEADLPLIRDKVDRLNAMDSNDARKRVLELLNSNSAEGKPPNQVTAVEAVATLSGVLGSGKPMFDYLERKFGTRIVANNPETTAELVRLSKLSPIELREALGLEPAERPRG